MISIHAPHARSDVGTTIQALGDQYFNPRSSCEERRAEADSFAFQHGNFNPRSSCEERHQKALRIAASDLISIHAPHARSDRVGCGFGRRKGISIHAPHARSDYRRSDCPAFSFISIHAPHARSDRCGCRSDGSRSYFNPRSSCEERHDVLTAEV